MGGQQSERSSAASSAGVPARPQQGVKDQAVAQAQTLVDQAKTTAQDRVRTAAQSGKDSAVDALSGVAQSLLVAGQQLQDQQKGVGRFVEQAAERVDRVAKYLDTAEVEELVERTERWARRNPALFLGSAFALGVLGARFLKTSKPNVSQPGGMQSRAGSAVPFSDREVRPVPAVEDL